MDLTILSRRERQVFDLMFSGSVTNKAISNELHVDERTAESHVASICRKLGVKSKAHLFLMEHPMNTKKPMDFASARKAYEASLKEYQETAMYLSQSVRAVLSVVEGGADPVKSLEALREPLAKFEAAAWSL